MHSFIVKIQNAFYFINFLAVDLLLKLQLVKSNPYSILLIRLDSIGDYVLFRNFIEQIKKSNRFKDYKVTLCGNILWANLAETLDSNVIDNFIWIDRNKFYRNIFYKYKILKQVRKQGFGVVIDSTYSREILYGDSIVKVSGAKEKIGSTGSLDSYAVWKRSLLSNKYYTSLIPSGTENLFEFNRNKYFFEQILNEEIMIRKPHIDVLKVSSGVLRFSEYIVIFPGAKHSERRWNTNNFAEILEFILTKYDMNIIIAGSEDDYRLAEEMTSEIKPDRVLNLTGKTTLYNLAKIISEARLLITNDTGAAHIAAAVNCSFVCISNGNHFGRFHPYPKEIFNEAYYIYPPEIMNKLGDFEFLSQKYRFSSDLDINTIKPGTVKEVIREILK